MSDRPTLHNQQQSILDGANISGDLSIGDITQILSQVIINIGQGDSSRVTIFKLTEFWEDWAEETNPAIVPSLVIGGRDDAQNSLVQWLSGDPASFSLKADSAEESILFLAAILQRSDTQLIRDFLTRAVVVTEERAWYELVKSPQPLLLIPTFEQLRSPRKAIKNGHHVFIPLGQVGGSSTTSLPRIIRDSAEKSLLEMEIPRQEAITLATLARRSLPALWRKLAFNPEIREPVWSHANQARPILAAMLAGAWSDSESSEDRSALEKLAGIPSQELEAQLIYWSQVVDPPVRKVGDVWMIAAQEDAWRLIARHLTKDDLKRFEAVAIDILGELNPAFELPVDQRYAASVYGRVLKHSKYLRKGIAGTLALMATLSDEIKFVANRTGEQVTDQIVRQLMEKAKENIRIWESLVYELPLLAEAAPQIVLNATQECLRGENPLLAQLFQDNTDNALTASSPHTGLLWALETLAWHPDYLSPVSLILAKLNGLDPGGKLANRPSKSLCDIFICWHPNTTASPKDRLAALDLIRQKESDTAWGLLIGLLPKNHSVSFPTHVPKWRDWILDTRQKINRQEYMDITNTILDKLLKDAGQVASRWCNLIDELANLPSPQIEALLRHLEDLEPEQFSQNECVKLWNCLRDEITQHRDFPDAKWVMPTPHIERLEAIYSRFEPTDPIEKSSWLFTHHPDIQGLSRKVWQEREDVIQPLRAQALEQIIHEQGWSGVLELANKAPQPALVGHALAKADLLPIPLNIFLRENLASPTPSTQMAQRFIRVTAYEQGDNWVDRCIRDNLAAWSAEQYGQFMVCLPFNVALLNRLVSVDEEIQAYFWKNRQDISLLGADHAGQVINQLLKYQRSHLAVTLIAWGIRQTSNIVNLEKIAEVLEIAILSSPEVDVDISEFVYQSAQLVDFLKKKEFSRERLADLELRYLHVHEHERRPSILYEELSHNSNIFIEALQLIYAPNCEPSDDYADQRKEFSDLVWRLLESWKYMPGTQPDKSVDAEALYEWVKEVRISAAKKKLEKIADIYIGHALAFSPVDPDGIWPHTAVRDLLRELENSDIERGWRSQIFNNRGVTTRLPTDGGQQERDLAGQYFEAARKLNPRWPRTAAVLRELATDYQQQAKSHDDSAELTQDFWN